MPSRSGEFHPEPLTDPDLILSHHPARATARRLPPSIEHWVPPAAGWTRHRLTRINVDGLLPSLHGHYPASPLLQSSPPLAGASVFQPRGWSHLCFFPWHRRLGSHVPYQSLIELRAAYMPDVYERWRWALRVRQSGVDPVAHAVWTGMLVTQGPKRKCHVCFTPQSGHHRWPLAILNFCSALQAH